MGTIISFEGLPGVGKTTLVQNVRKRLEQESSYKIATIKELDLIDGSKSEIMDRTMRIFTSSDDCFQRQFDPFIDTFFAQAVRYLICKEVIEKNSGNYDIILEDRGVDSYFSFALAGLKMRHNYDFNYAYNFLSKMNLPVNITADYTFRLKDTVPNCVYRFIKRGEADILKEGIEFLEYVDQAYEFLSRENPRRITDIDVTELTQENTLQEILLHLQNKKIMELNI